jgi:zinc transport system substrate-binding protein
MKRILIFALLLALLIPYSFGCGAPADEERISIVCTLFPQYDWVRSIVGESKNVEVTLLIKNGSDPHSYQPTAADIMTVSNCDMIVYIGADSDVWVKDALKRANNESTLKVALSDIEGMTLHNVSSSSHDHGEHEEHSHGEHHHGVFDEHLWLSLRNAAIATEYLSERICALDKENEELYKANAKAYKDKLLALDLEYKTAIEAAGEHPFMLFADRFPFVYLLEDYGIDYAAAFEGCTTDVDAGFDTVLRLIKEAEEHNVSHIAVTESSDKALAKTVAESAKGNIEITVLNSLQSVNTYQLANGYSYLSVMRNNLGAVRTALGQKGN